MTEFFQTATISFDSATGRAVFVVACFAIAFVAARYYKSIHDLTISQRLVLLVLRIAYLLILALMIGGLTVRWREAGARRVLLKSIGDETRLAQVRSNIERELSRHGISAIESQLTANDQNETSSSSILITDGAMFDSEAREAVSDLHSQVSGNPVDVLTEDMESQRRASLRSVKTEGDAIAGVPLLIRCTVHALNMNGRESILTIADEATVQNSAKIKWGSPDELRTVDIEVTPKIAGEMIYEIRVDGGEGEPVLGMSIRKMIVTVEDRRFRVMFVESEPTWDGKFIKRALDSMTSFDLDYFAKVSRETSIGIAAAGAPDTSQKRASSSPGSLAQLHSIIANSERLNTYDAIVVGASTNDMFSQAEVEKITTWIESKGGGLIILGSNSFAGSIASQSGRLNRLMPAIAEQKGFASAEQSQSTPVVGDEDGAGYMLARVGGEQRSAMDGFFSSLETEKKSDIQLDGSGFVFGELRAGASMLANLRSKANSTESPRAAIVSMQLGQGEVIAFGPADSWKIKTSQTGGDDRKGPYETLWQGCVLYATAGRLNGPEFQFGTETPRAGEEFPVTIRTSSKGEQPNFAQPVVAEIQKVEADGSTSDLRSLALYPDPAEPGSLKSVVKVSEVGEYVLVVGFGSGDKQQSISRRFIVAGKGEQEPGVAEPVLREASLDTNGNLFHAAQVPDLVRNITSRAVIASHHDRQWQLRELWPLALFIPLLMALEWFLQRTLLPENHPQ